MWRSRFRAKTDAVGGRFAEDRQVLVSQKQQLAARIAELEKRIQDTADSVLPFLFCPKLIRRTATQMTAEEKSLQLKTASERLESVFNRVEGQLTREASPRYKSFLEILRIEICSETQDAGGPILHGHSEDARKRILSWFEKAAVDVGPELKATSIELENAIREQQAVEMRLRQVPEEDALQPIMEELAEKHKKQAVLTHELQLLADESDRLRRECVGAERIINKIRERLDATATQNGQLDLLKRCQGGLAKYRSRLIHSKAAILEEHVTQCLKLLARKTDMVQRVEIDPVAFSIVLRDRYGAVIPKRELSAGEKQIYAIAVLWGLARTSGRALPMIIDTPLARLDSDHRRNLVKNYFPRAAEQVVILSTDTEIDETYFEALSKHVSRAYQLEFNEQKLCTSLKEGYFWRSN